MAQGVDVGAGSADHFPGVIDPRSRKTLSSVLEKILNRGTTGRKAPEGQVTAKGLLLTWPGSELKG